MKLLPENILKCMQEEDREKYVKGQLTIAEALDKYARRQEKELHRLFNDWLSLRDLDYTHSRMDKPATIKKGTLDYHVWKGERHCFVEFKSEHGRLRPEQEAFITRQCERGTPTLVTTSYAEATQFVSHVLGLELPY